LDIIGTGSTQPSSLPELLNTAPRANEVLADPSADLVLPEGSKRIRRQAYVAVLANIPTLFGYYAGFTIGLVKDINRTRSSLYRDNLLPEPRNLKELKKHPLTTSF